MPNDKYASSRAKWSAASKKGARTPQETKGRSKYPGQKTALGQRSKKGFMSKPGEYSRTPMQAARKAGTVVKKSSTAAKKKK
jgi:hypothetical protein